MRSGITKEKLFEESGFDTKVDFGQDDPNVLTRESWSEKEPTEKYSGWVNPLSIMDDGMDDDKILDMNFKPLDEPYRKFVMPAWRYDEDIDASMRSESYAETEVGKQIEARASAQKKAAEEQAKAAAEEEKKKQNATAPAKKEAAPAEQKPQEAKKAEAPKQQPAPAEKAAPKKSEEKPAPAPEAKAAEEKPKNEAAKPKEEAPAPAPEKPAAPKKAEEKKEKTAPTKQAQQSAQGTM